jgi:hypothetical protein
MGRRVSLSLALPSVVVDSTPSRAKDELEQNPAAPKSGGLRTHSLDPRLLEARWTS